MPDTIIYTDGSCLGNPGAGGYGVILIDPKSKRTKELSKGFRRTTNNRMELWAAIAGLEELKRQPQEVLIYSDSRYLIQPVEKGWLWKWEKTNFKKKKNRDLWERFIGLYKQHKISFQWVKGHAGDTYNERCDEIAKRAAEGKHLSIDTLFEQPAAPKNLLDLS